MKSGDSFIHYEVRDHIGAGGMGEVFRAHDTKLRRDVALKVLPPGFADDPERRARFEREARTLASLQHPNVASIYGFEEVEGRLFLVMELIEGEDLAERLARGPLPVERALEIAGGIAEGLEAAHEKGIIHRDLKPANVKLTPEGQVKILDFGLARAFEAETPEGDPSDSPTLTGAMTQAGVILGTAAYMSPEQARGRIADRRSDVWAFGCVCYEMLTGKRLFAGETVSDTLAAVLRKDPDWDALPEGLDPAVLLMLRRCLERKPVDRLQHMGDARILLAEKVDSGARQDPASSGRLRTTAAVLAVLLLVSAAFNIFRPGGGDEGMTVEEAGVQHLAASLAPRAPLARARAHPLGIARPSLAISPDGNVLVYVAEVDGNTRLFKKRFDAAGAEEIPGTEGGFHPVFSPSGDWIAYFTDEKVRKVLFAGSEPVTLCDAPNPMGLAWESDRSLIIAVKEGRRLLRVDTDSGRSVELEDADRLSYLSVLPGSGRLLGHQPYVTGINPDAWHVGTIDPADGGFRSLVEGGFSARYVPTGHLVYVRGGNLMGVAFDPESLETSGRPVPVIAGLRIARRSLPSYDFSDDGTLIYLSGPPQTLSDLVWVDGNGATTELPIPSQFFGDFQISPDGRHVAATVGGGRNEVWVYDLNRGTRRKLTTEGDGTHPIWSPDGRSIVFCSRRDGDLASWVRPVDGRQPARRIEAGGVTGYPYAWPAMGQITVNDDSGVYMLDLEADTAAPVATTDANEWGAHVSPDGRWIAYTSDESGRYEVYVKAYPELAGAWAISSNGGEEPVWSRDGRSLYYRNGDAWLRVAVTTESDFSAGQPQVAMEGPFINVPGRSYDLSPDGSRFLVIRDVGNEEFSRHVEVILNWFDELERLVPTE